MTNGTSHWGKLGKKLEKKFAKQAFFLIYREIDRELVVCRVAIGKGVLSATLNREIDVPKLEKFKGERSVREVDNFLWEMEQYFLAMSIKDNEAKVNIIAKYFTDFALLWWKRRSTYEKRCQATIGT